MIINQISPAVQQVIDQLRRSGLELGDLTAFGGEDLRDPRRREKARRVERCWALMARLGVNHADLENALSGEFAVVAQQPPAKPTRRRRGDPVFSQPIESTKQLSPPPPHKKPNENNDLALSVPVDGPEIKSGENIPTGIPADQLSLFTPNGRAAS